MANETANAPLTPPCCTSSSPCPRGTTRLRDHEAGRATPGQGHDGTGDALRVDRPDARRRSASRARQADRPRRSTTSAASTTASAPSGGRRSPPSSSGTARSSPSPGGCRRSLLRMAYELSIRRYRHWYARLLRLYPKPYRQRFGEGMEQTFNDLCRARAGEARGLFGLAFWVFAETSAGIIGENMTSMSMQNKTSLHPGSCLLPADPRGGDRGRDEVVWAVRFPDCRRPPVRHRVFVELLITGRGVPSHRPGRWPAVLWSGESRRRHHR